MSSDSSLVLRIDRHDVVEAVEVDGLGLRSVEGAPLVASLAADSVDDAIGLLERARVVGTALPRRLVVVSGKRSWPVLLSAVQVDGSTLLHGGIDASLATPPDHRRRRADRNASEDDGRAQEDADILSEFTQLTNELSALSRLRAQQAAELQAAREKQNELLGMAAHDLRNPLTLIRGVAETILALEDGGMANPEDRRFLEIILRHADGMSRLIDDLLSVSELSSGAVSLRLQTVDLVSLVLDAVEARRARAVQKEILLALELPSDPVEAEVDAGKVEQIVDNLISNALKYSQPRTMVIVRVVVGVGRATITVTDQGPGIPDDERPLVFEAFRQLSARPTGGERSTGLGLAIVQRLVEAHGGHIEVESELGVGSTFRVELPLRGR